MTDKRNTHIVLTTVIIILFFYFSFIKQKLHNLRQKGIDHESFLYTIFQINLILYH
jgi:hypothetical protein